MGRPRYCLRGSPTGRRQSPPSPHPSVQMLSARRLMSAWLLRLGSALRAPLRRIVAGMPLPPPAPPPAQPLAVPLLSRVPFRPPSWAQSLRAPSERIVLGHMPTPLMPWACPELQELGVRWVIKRDDMTGLELSGNKVRKLEFLMRDALAAGCDCVITIGGIQSNHCRATAAAARLVGLEPHLILRCPAGEVDGDPGLVGNLLLDRMLGATLHLVTIGEYATRGQAVLTAALAGRLAAQGRRPYVIPVGGSNALGTWGYLDAVEELRRQVGGEGRWVRRIGEGGKTRGYGGSGGARAGRRGKARLWLYLAPRPHTNRLLARRPPLLRAASSLSAPVHTQRSPPDDNPLLTPPPRPQHLPSPDPALAST
eukprot:scaffold16378_cov112-Isochrysis_galbana.AAC.5